MSPRAMVLGAGLGTRLRPLTHELPKPLVPVGDRPLLAHIAERLARAGFVELCLNTHHLPEAFVNVGKDLKLEIEVLHEPVIRGTAGGLAGARSRLGPAPILLWNGDILADPPLAELGAAAASDGGLVLAVAPVRAGAGTVGVAEDGSVVRLRGERFGHESWGGDYIGVAGIGERCLRTLPEMGCLIGDWALPELRQGRSVRVVEASGAWSDAGDLRAYLAQNLGWLEGRGLGSWVAPDAEVGHEVVLERTIVGRGAHVGGRGKLERVVIWPGATVTAPLADAIVTTSGQIVPVA